MAIDEDGRPKGIRRDPREELSTPPVAREEFVAPVRRALSTREEPEGEPEPPSSRRGAEPPRDDPKRPRAVVTISDPRLEAVEQLLGSGAWDEIRTRLGPDDQAGKLPPTLGLVYALARSESPDPKGTSVANEIAIRCMAALFSVPEGSPIALLLAKRILRKNPAAWRSQPAPPPRVSIPIMIVALAIGGAVGWWLSHGGLRLR